MARVGSEKEGGEERSVMMMDGMVNGSSRRGLPMANGSSSCHGTIQLQHHTSSTHIHVEDSGWFIIRTH